MEDQPLLDDVPDPSGSILTFIIFSLLLQIRSKCVKFGWILTDTESRQVSLDSIDYHSSTSLQDSNFVLLVGFHRLLVPGLHIFHIVMETEVVH